MQPKKVHGSNFSIYLHNNKIQFAKRNGFLQEDEWFYNYQFIKDKLIRSIKKMSAYLNHKNIIIYGELFGGWYPENVQTWSGAHQTRINERGICILPFEDRAIQEGIYYSPNIEYMVFDIALKYENNIEFLDYYQMIDCVKQTELIYSQPLLIDTFENVQKLNINFDSKVPIQLGFKELPKNTNIAEGIVIKPINNSFINDVYDRCMIKIKNKNFLEIEDDFNMNEAKKSYQYVFSKLINQNRFVAVLSKNGRLTKENSENILNQFIEDIWDDFYKHFSHIIIEDIEKVNKFIHQYSKLLLNENL